MTTDTAGSGIREIDTGTLPDRYARGWHCLGPVKDYLDGEPHAVEAFGTKLVAFADSHCESVKWKYPKRFTSHGQGVVVSTKLDPQKLDWQDFKRAQSWVPVQ